MSRFCPLACGHSVSSFAQRRFTVPALANCFISRRHASSNFSVDIVWLGSSKSSPRATGGSLLSFQFLPYITMNQTCRKIVPFVSLATDFHQSLPSTGISSQLTVSSNRVSPRSTDPYGQRFLRSDARTKRTTKARHPNGQLCEVRT